MGVQVCSGETGVADTAARVRGGAGRESRRRFGRHAWDLERDSLGHGYLARKHHPARVGEKPGRWQNVGRRRSCGLQTWGLGRPELQAPQGQGGGPAENGLTELEEAEPGRRAGWLGGRVPLGREGGRERDRPGREKRREQRRPLCGLGGIWAARSGIPGLEYPASSSRRKRLSLSPWQSTLERTAAQQGSGQSPGGSPPCCPAEATGGCREHSSPFILEEICPGGFPANFPSGDRTGCVPGHTPRICEGGEGTFCPGSGPPSPTWPRPAP